jgi:hypothetical protein
MSDQLTLFAEDFPVRTSALPARVRGSPASVPAYGVSTPALLANFDQSTLSWKTSQRCFLGDWQTFSETWPRSGMTQNGIAYQLQALVRLTDATESGSWPTPAACDAIGTGRTFVRKDAPKAGLGLRGAVTASQLKFHTPRTTPRSAREYDGETPLGNGGLNPPWVEWLMGFPIGWTDLEPSETP